MRAPRYGADAAPFLGRFRGPSRSTWRKSGDQCRQPRDHLILRARMILGLLIRRLRSLSSTDEAGHFYGQGEGSTHIYRQGWLQCCLLPNSAISTCS
jgi:hypothetical protein